MQSGTEACGTCASNGPAACRSVAVKDATSVADVRFAGPLGPSSARNHAARAPSQAAARLGTGSSARRHVATANGCVPRRARETSLAGAYHAHQNFVQPTCRVCACGTSPRAGCRVAYCHVMHRSASNSRECHNSCVQGWRRLASAMACACEHGCRLAQLRRQLLCSSIMKAWHHCAVSPGNVVGLGHAAAIAAARLQYRSFAAWRGAQRTSAQLSILAAEHSRRTLFLQWRRVVRAVPHCSRQRLLLYSRSTEAASRCRGMWGLKHTAMTAHALQARHGASVRLEHTLSARVAAKQRLVQLLWGWRGECRRRAQLRGTSALSAQQAEALASRTTLRRWKQALHALRGDRQRSARASAFRSTCTHKQLRQMLLAWRHLSGT